MGVAEREQGREPLLGIGRFGVLERRHGLGPVRGGLLVREQAAGALGRPAREGVRALGIPDRERLVVVVGELGHDAVEVVAVAALQLGGRALVQARARAGREPLQRRLLEQRVREAPRARRVAGLDHAGAGGLVEQVERGLALDARDRGRERALEVATQNRGGPDRARAGR
jgi:hypothetical protein